MADIIKFKQFFKDDLGGEDANDVLKEGQLCWRCNCGGHTFFITPEGPICKQCGIDAIGWNEVY